MGGGFRQNKPSLISLRTHGDTKYCNINNISNTHIQAMHTLQPFPPFSICQGDPAGGSGWWWEAGMCCMCCSLREQGIEMTFLQIRPSGVFVHYTPLTNLPNLAASPLLSQFTHAHLSFSLLWKSLMTHLRFGNKSPLYK